DSFQGNFLDKKIVIASKRGRSHAHEGTFRDDDFCTKSLPNDWAIVAVADGAGSAKYARQGSKIATHFIAERFNDEVILNEFDKLVTEYFLENPESKLASEAEIKIETQNIETKEQTVEENNVVENSTEEIVDVMNTDDEPVEVPVENLKLNAKRSIVKALYAGVSDLYSELLKFATDDQLELKNLNST